MSFPSPSPTPAWERGTPAWERGTPTVINSKFRSLLLSPPPLALIVLFGGLLCALCTNTHNANNANYYDSSSFQTYDQVQTAIFAKSDHTEPFNPEESSTHPFPSKASFSFEQELFAHPTYEFQTFLIAGLLGAGPTLLSNVFSDTGTLPSNGLPSPSATLYFFSILSALLVTGTTPLQSFLVASPFLCGFFLPKSQIASNTLSNRLGVLAPHTLLLFLISYFLPSPETGASKTTLLVILALAVFPSYTTKRGLALLVFVLFCTLPFCLDFTNLSPVRPPLTAVVVLACTASLWGLSWGHRHQHGGLSRSSPPPTTRSFSIACVSSLRIALALSAVHLADSEPDGSARDPTLVLF